MGMPHCDDVGHEMHTVINDDGSTSNHCIRTIHAEQNVITQAARMGISLDQSTIYCHMTPCYTCAKMIVNSGIKRVVASKDYQVSYKSKDLFKKADVELVIINPEVERYK
jgi:dCMP deaminase